MVRHLHFLSLSLLALGQALVLANRHLPSRGALLRRESQAVADELEGGAARRAGARGLRRGSARAAGVLCGRSWRGGAARLHRGRRCAAPLTIDCLRLRDVGGGEIDQRTMFPAYSQQLIRENPASRGTDTSAEVLVGN